MSRRKPTRFIAFDLPDGGEASETPRSRQYPHKRREIVRAAMKIADAEGIEAVSMRRVAAELDVGTMTLYSYVASKGDLFALMSDAIGREILLDEVPADWRQALREIARATREMMLRHPWALLARTSRPEAIPVIFLHHVDQSLQAVAGLDVDYATKMAILRAVDDLTMGAVIDDLEERDRQGPAFDVASMRAVAERDGLVHLQQSLDEVVEHVSPFEKGLDWLIAGIEASLTGAASHARAGRRRGRSTS